MSSAHLPSMAKHVAWPFLRLAICPTGHFSDNPFLRQPICPTSHLSDKPFVRQAIYATSHLSDKPFVRQAISPTSHLSDSLFVQQAIGPTSHLSDWPFVRLVYMELVCKSETPYGAKHLPKANLGLLPALVSLAHIIDHP